MECMENIITGKRPIPCYRPIPDDVHIGYTVNFLPILFRKVMSNLKCQKTTSLKMYGLFRCLKGACYKHSVIEQHKGITLNSLSEFLRGGIEGGCGRGEVY